MKDQSTQIKLISLREAEDLTGRKVATWRKDIRERRFPYVTVGRQIRLRLADVRQMVDAGFRPAVTK